MTNTKVKRNILSARLKGQCHVILVKIQNAKSGLCINEDQRVMMSFFLPMAIELH